MDLSAFASHTQFERESGRYNVKADGAVGDGTTDDTVAIQTTLNRFTNGVAATKSGHIYFPTPSVFYKITETLIYGGSVGDGLRLEGGLGGSRGPSGAQIVWYGASGGTMFIANGANGFLMENLEFYDRGLAKYGLHFIATNVWNTTLGTVVTPGVVEVTPASMANIAVGTLLNIDAGASLEYVYVTAVTGATFTATFAKSHGSSAVVGNGAPSTGITLRNLTIGAGVGAGSAAIAFGNVTSASTMQVSEVDMYNLVLRGDQSTSAAGIVTLCSGNTKNFKLYGGTIAYFNYGIDWALASGIFKVDGTVFGNMMIADIRTGTGDMFVNGVESEGSDYMFVVGTTGTNPGSLTIIGSSWQGGTGADDLMIDYSGSITLIGNTFNNNRTGATIPKIRNNAAFADISVSSVFSQGNFYLRAPAGFIPLINGSNVDVWTLDKSLLSVTSIGDYGGTGGALVKLTNFLPFAVMPSATIQTGTILVSEPAFNATQTWNDAGVTFTGIKLNVTSTASAAASKVLDLQVGAATVFSVNKAGEIVYAGGYLSSTAGMFLYSGAASSIAIVPGGAAAAQWRFDSSAGIFLPDGTTNTQDIGTSSKRVKTLYVGTSIDAPAASIATDTTTGLKIGTGTTQKIGLWNATPVVQPTAIADADGTLADITTKFNSLLSKLGAIGALAP